MRGSAILSEAVRNLVSGTTRAALLATAFVALIGTLAVMDVRAVTGVLEGAAAFRTSGAATQYAQSDDHVDGSRCDVLASTVGIREAGALRGGTPLRPLALPAAEIRVWEVTPGLLGLLADTGALRSLSDGAAGVWLSDDLAETLGVGPGDELPTAAGTAAVAGTYTWPDDGRVRTLGYSAIAPVPATGVFDECWAEVWPPDPDGEGLIHTTLLIDSQAEPVIGRLNDSLGAHYDAHALLDGRLTRHAPAGAAVLGVGLGFLAIRLRRLELSAALHARVPKVHVAWQVLLETAAWVTAAALVVLAATAWVASHATTDPAVALWAVGLRTVLAGATATGLGALVGAAVTREKHLFKYFKDR